MIIHMTLSKESKDGDLIKDFKQAINNLQKTGFEGKNPYDYLRMIIVAIGRDMQCAEKVHEAYKDVVKPFRFEF